MMTATPAMTNRTIPHALRHEVADSRGNDSRDARAYEQRFPDRAYILRQTRKPVSEMQIQSG